MDSGGRVLLILGLIIYLLWLAGCDQSTPLADVENGSEVSVTAVADSALTSITVTNLPPTVAALDLSTTVTSPALEFVTATPIPSSTPEPSPTPLPTNTPVPTDTYTPTATPSPTNTPVPSATATAVSVTVNGVPVNEFIHFSPEVVANARAIFSRGREIGRNPNAFSKVGDSVTLTDHYLTRFDSGYYTLGDYGYLQPAIDHFAGSFARYGVAARIGLHAWSLFDPLWANKDYCLANEDMVACEIRLHNPSILLIRLGSNDNAPGSYFEDNMRLLVTYSIEQGVLPVLATKPDRFEGPDDRNNQAVRRLAAEYQLPLWDFDRFAETIPGKGLGGDLVHMTMADADDYTNPEYFERGYPMSDLTALMMLHAVYTEVIQPGDA